MLDYSLRSRAWAAGSRKNRRSCARSRMRSTRAVRSGAPTSTAGARARRRWWNWKPATHALDYLWMSGRMLVHSRRTSRSASTCAERVMPEPPRLREPPARGGLPALAPATVAPRDGRGAETDLPDVPDVPAFRAAERRPRTARPARPGEVVEIEVEGDRDRWLALAEDLPALAPAPAAGGSRPRARRCSRPSTRSSGTASARGGCSASTTDRGLHARPQARARLLHAADLPRRPAHRPHRPQDPPRRAAPRGQGVHFEPWFARGAAPPAATWGAVDRDAALAGIAEALRSLATFVGADEVTVGHVTPKALSPPLRRAL